jgi:hypothetical protein
MSWSANPRSSTTSPPFDVLNQVIRNQANPLLAANECFQRSPLGLELLPVIVCFPCDDVLKLGIDLGQFGFVHAQLGDTTFVVGLARRLVDHRLLDVVDRDVDSPKTVRVSASFCSIGVAVNLERDLTVFHQFLLELIQVERINTKRFQCH